jgi:ribonuclease HI
VGCVAAGKGAQRPRRLKILFDGGCHLNPGGATYFIDDLGRLNSTDAEWLALLEALRLASSLGERDFELIGDCAHVIRQANGLS